MSKKTIISIPQCAATFVLKSLQENSIRCEYLGIDQAGKILMQANYEDEQEELIGDLNDYMEKSEMCLNEINQAIKTLMEEGVPKSDEEAEKRIREFTSNKVWRKTTFTKTN